MPKLLALILGWSVVAWGVVDTRRPAAAGFDFAVIGDAPYDARQEAEFVRLMNDVDAADVAFVVHVGDFWGDGSDWTAAAGGRPPCSDEAFQDRFERAQASRHPFVFVAGDNDWADCHRAKPTAYDPLERLARLRRTFFAGDESLGRQRLRLTRPGPDGVDAAYRENARWTRGGVSFVTLQVVGSNNNLGRTPEMDAEHTRRMAANVEWMRSSFEQARRDGSRAVVLIAQANPRFETSWPSLIQQRYMLGGLGFKSPDTRRATGFDGFLEALERQALAFGKPVVYIHGDTHLFRVDKPLVGSRSGRIVENFTRVETFGHPDTHWVRGTVDPSDPAVLRFRAQIVDGNRIRH